MRKWLLRLFSCSLHRSGRTRLTYDLSHPPVPEKSGSGNDIQRGRLHGLGRRCRSSLLFAVLFLFFFGLAAYLFLEDDRQDTWAHARTDIADMPPPKLLPPELKEIVGSFKPNQTVTEALLQQGLSSNLIYEIVDCARPVYNLAKVRADRSYWLRFTQDGTFRDFRYPVDDERYLTVYQDVTRNKLVPVMKEFQFEIRLSNISAVIEDSLYGCIVGIGEDYQLALDLADIFGYDIDFNTDIQKGDSFRALIEKRFLDGQFVKNGAILVASVSNQGKMLTGIRFEDENGKPAYYAPDGKALKRSFLKSPLRVFRITSRFSYGRMHPILKVVRPHLGVDYAAPIGTPVQAVGSGIVVSAGAKGGNGKMVHLRHAGGYETKYLHLSRITVKVGARVSQGEIVGYVGSSGLSTGPHLDFRISRHGTPLNPLKVIFPPAKPVAPEKFSHFAALRDRLTPEVQITNTDSQQANR
jgi:murein DD-endopeptidase MepM/ murein hydrolase activator NlpD